MTCSLIGSNREFPQRSSWHQGYLRFFRDNAGQSCLLLYRQYVVLRRTSLEDRKMPGQHRTCWLTKRFTSWWHSQSSLLTRDTRTAGVFGPRQCAASSASLWLCPANALQAASNKPRTSRVHHSPLWPIPHGCLLGIRPQWLP